jgi:hypothetical protein
VTAVQRGDGARTDRPFGVSASQRHEMVAVAAYLRAERRGFAPGREIDDWYAAAADVDAMLTRMGALGVTRGEYERVGLRNALRLWAG